MLRQKQSYFSFKGNHGLMSTLRRRSGASSGVRHISRRVSGGIDCSAGEAPERDEADAPLDDAAQDERDYVRQRLREELKREPTDEELDEWLRQHTEGY